MKSNEPVSIPAAITALLPAGGRAAKMAALTEENRQHHRFLRVANIPPTTHPGIALRLKFTPMRSSSFPAGQDV
jgi:hypothetical protein